MACGLVGWSAYTRTGNYLGTLKPDKAVVLVDFPGIAGIAYWPERGTLLGVAGNGEVAELDLNGRVLRKRTHGQRTFAAIALLAEPGLALVLDARSRRLVRLRLADFAIDSEREMPGGTGPTRNGNPRVLGLALAGSPPSLVLSSEFPPAVTRFDAARGTPQHSVLLGARSVSGVMAGPNGELLMVSRENGLLMIDANGHTLGGWWRPVEFDHIEGAALVPGVGLVLCVDRDPGVLLVFSSIRDWEGLRRAFAA